MGSGVNNILNVLASGFATTYSVSAVLSFLVMFLFFVNLAFKSKQADARISVGREVYWGILSALSCFMLCGVFVFLAHTPLLQYMAYQVYVWGLTVTQFLILISLLGWIFLGVYLCLPVRQKGKKIGYGEEDDISMVPYVGVLFGFCMAMLTFGAVKWPSELLDLVKNTEVVGQGSFYGFVYILPVVVIWSVLAYGLYIVTKRLFESFVPKFAPLVMLTVVFIYQLAFQYL